MGQALGQGGYGGGGGNLGSILSQLGQRQQGYGGQSQGGMQRRPVSYGGGQGSYSDPSGGSHHWSPQGGINGPQGNQPGYYLGNSSGPQGGSSWGGAQGGGSIGNAIGALSGGGGVSANVPFDPNGGMTVSNSQGEGPASAAAPSLGGMTQTNESPTTDVLQNPMKRRPVGGYSPDKQNY